MRGGGTLARKRIAAKWIKQDLLDQLERNGTTGEHFINLVDDYMGLWKIKNLLFDDIKKSGITIRYDNGGGQKGSKKNDKVDQLLKVNERMLKLLNDLGIKAMTIGGEDGNEEM